MNKKQLIDFINRHFEDGDNTIAVNFLNYDDIDVWWVKLMERRDEKDVLNVESLGKKEVTINGVSKKRLNDFLRYLNNITYESLWDWDFIEHIAGEYIGKIDITKGELYYEQKEVQAG